MAFERNRRFIQSITSDKYATYTETKLRKVAEVKA